MHSQECERQNESCLDQVMKLEAQLAQAGAFEEKLSLALNSVSKLETQLKAANKMGGRKQSDLIPDGT